MAMQTACECTCIRLEALPPAIAQGLRNSVRERGEQTGLPGGDQGQYESF